MQQGLRTRSLVLALLVGLLASALTPATAHAARPGGEQGHAGSAPALQQLPVADATITQLTVTGFRVVDGVLHAVGRASGTFRDATGALQTFTDQAFTAPVTQATGSCPILTLRIDRIHLDLLGLVLNVQPIDVRLVAQPGQGRLLGNLLCTVARLLDNPGRPVNAIANLLDRIIGIVGPIRVV